MTYEQGISSGFCKIASLVLLMLYLSDAFAGPFVEIGIGRNGVLNSQEWWNGRNSIGCNFAFGWIERRGNWQGSIQWDHYSHCTRGDPFDGRDEHTLDAVYLKLRREWE